MCKDETQQSSDVSSWVTYHIVAAQGGRTRIYEYMRRLRTKKAIQSMDPQELFETVSSLRKEIDWYLSYVDDHLTRALEHIPKTERNRKMIDKRNRENSSLVREYWTPKDECKRPAEYSGFKTANEYRTTGENKKNE